MVSLLWGLFPQRSESTTLGTATGVYAKSIHGSHDCTSWMLTNTSHFSPRHILVERKVSFHLQDDCETRLFVQADTGHMWTGTGPKPSSSPCRGQTLWYPVPKLPKRHSPIVPKRLSLSISRSSRDQTGERQEKKKIHLSKRVQKYYHYVLDNFAYLA